MSNREDLITSAYHEAGHAVIAWYYGRRILGAAISQDKDNKGHCEIIRLLGRIPNIKIHELEREMDIIMAGAIAEEQLTGNKNFISEWGGTDYPDAVDVAVEWARMTGKKLNNDYLIDQSIEVDGIKGIFFQQKFFDEFGNNVRNLTSRPHIWTCVQAVATALLKHKELSGDEVSSIISKVWEGADGSRQEELIENQRQNEEERPWGEWRQD